MNREIKFRIWAKDYCSNLSKEEMVYLPKWTVFDGQDLVFRTDLETYWIDSSLSGEAKIMQYTGLKDKNGKEIYEGDLFAAPVGNVFECYWDNVNFKFTVKLIRLNGKMVAIRTPFFSEFSSYEILGNIHENPELLK